MSLGSQLVLFEEDHKKICRVADQLVRDANAKAIFLVDRNGQLVAEAAGEKFLSLFVLWSLIEPSVQ